MRKYKKVTARKKEVTVYKYCIFLISFFDFYKKIRGLLWHLRKKRYIIYRKNGSGGEKTILTRPKKGLFLSESPNKRHITCKGIKRTSHQKKRHSPKRKIYLSARELKKSSPTNRKGLCRHRPL